MDHVTFIGLDVHKDTIAVALLRPADGVPDELVIQNTPEDIKRFVRRLGPAEWGRPIVRLAVSGATNLAVNRSKHERRSLYQRVWVRI